MSDTNDDQSIPHPGEREPAEGGREEVDEQLGQTGTGPSEQAEDEG
jgi:hypothetical protein